MRGFKAGTFDRDQMPNSLRKFSPTESLTGIEQVDLEGLKSAGKTLILLDVDNTLLPWRSRDIPDATMNWIARAREMGFEFCVLSNTRHPERLQDLTDRMQIEYVRDKFKPHTRMYFIALEKFGRQPKEAVMIGDQLLTDVLGANRAGIDAIWVRPMARKEFIGTSLISRNVERIIGRFLYRFFQADENNIEHPPTKPGFFEHNVVREFLKFGVVGGTSTVVDLGLHYFLMHSATWNGSLLVDVVGRAFLNQQNIVSPTVDQIQQAAFAPLKVGPVLLAILNSYIWNSRWTFRAQKSGGAKRLLKFYVVSIIALLLNIVISSAVYRIVPWPSKRWAIASVVAMVVVAFWNFSGQKLWTFRDRHPK